MHKERLGYSLVAEYVLSTYEALVLLQAPKQQLQCRQRVTEQNIWIELPISLGRVSTSVFNI